MTTSANLAAGPPVDPATTDPATRSATPAGAPVAPAGAGAPRTSTPADRAGRARTTLPPGAIAVVVLAGAAGVALWWGTAGPGAGLLDHGTAGPTRHGAGHPAGGVDVRNLLVALAGFTAAWVLMTVATMLPTALPLLGAVGQVTRHRPDRRRLAVAVVVGFLAVWAAAGLAAAGATRLVHALVPRTPAADRPALVAAAILAAAGSWQLSGLTDRCLRGCRSPAGFLHRHWGRAGAPARRAFAVGMDYGRSCLGCCAALMAVMLVVGMGSLAGMYAVAFIGAAEKHTRWGPSLVRPVGVALLAAAACTALVSLVPAVG